MANNFYGCIATTGGTDGSLDKIDGSILADGDGAFVIHATNNTIAHYTLDSGSGAAESDPRIISPDTNPGTKRWILIKTVALGADFDGYEVVLDQDGDTSITADTDDQIDFKTGGTDRMSLTNSGLSLASGARANEFSTDGTLAGDSDTAVPTEKAVKTYVDTALLYQSGKNAIINGNFDVWQRGTGPFTTSGDYAADRFAVYSGGSSVSVTPDTFTVGQTDVPLEPEYSLKAVVTSAAGASNYAQMQHRIEDVRTFAGETVTFSFYLKTTSGSPIAIEFNQLFGSGGSAEVRTFVDKVTPAASGVWEKFSCTVSIPSISGKTVGSGSYLRITLWLDAGSDYDARTDTLGQQSDTFYLSQLQLERGSVATDFEKKTFAEELAACQRYFCKSFNYPTAPANGSFSVLPVGVAYAANNGRSQSIEFPVPMYSAPTVVPYGNSGNWEAYTSGAWSALSVTSLSSSTYNGFTAQLTEGASRWTANQALMLRGDWTAEAEL